MGIARLLMVGVAILVILALIVVGVLALVGALKSDDRVPAGAAGQSGRPGASAGPEAGSPAGATRTPAEIPTLYVECRADTCPLFVRATGGDVIEDRDLSRGQRAVYSQPALDVVLGDASTVYVEVKGEARAPGKPGQRQTFTIRN